MLTHGVNDPRVEVWQGTKTAARLVAAAADLKGTRPVLLRLDYQAGHGIGNTRNRIMPERADTFALFLWLLGVEGCEPQAKP